MKPGVDPEEAPFFQEGTGNQHKILQNLPKNRTQLIKNLSVR